MTWFLMLVPKQHYFLMTYFKRCSRSIVILLIKIACKYWTIKNPLLYRIIKIYSKEINEAVFPKIIQKKKQENNFNIHILTGLYLNFSSLFKVSIKCNKEKTGYFQNVSQIIICMYLPERQIHNSYMLSKTLF